MTFSGEKAPLNKLRNSHELGLSHFEKKVSVIHVDFVSNIPPYWLETLIKIRRIYMQHASKYVTRMGTHFSLCANLSTTPCLIKHHTMKSNRGNGAIAPSILNLEWSASCSGRFTLRWKPSVPFGQKAVWASEPLWRRRRREIPVICPYSL